MLLITDSVSGSMCTSLTPVALCIDVPGGEPFRLLDGAVWQYLDGPKITCNRIEHNRRCSFRINVGRPENKIRLVHMEETSTAMHQWECSDCSIHICNSCVTALLLMTQMITNLQVGYSMLHLFDVSVYTVPDLDDIYNWLRNLLRDDNYLSRLTYWVLFCWLITWVIIISGGGFSLFLPLQFIASWLKCFPHMWIMDCRWPYIFFYLCRNENIMNPICITYICGHHEICKKNTVCEYVYRLNVWMLAWIMYRLCYVTVFVSDGFVHPENQCTLWKSA